MDINFLSSPLVRVSHIQSSFGYGYHKAKKKFDKAKKLEHSKGIDLENERPYEVSTKIFIESLGLDPNYILKQAQLKQKEKHSVKSNQD